MHRLEPSILHMPSSVPGPVLQPFNYCCTKTSDGMAVIWDEKMSVSISSRYMPHSADLKGLQGRNEWCVCSIYGAINSRMSRTLDRCFKRVWK